MTKKQIRRRTKTIIKLNRKRRREREQIYFLNPKICVVCTKFLSYHERNHKTCSTKCGAISRAYEIYERRKKRWKVGGERVLERRSLKKYLIDERGAVCEGKNCLVSDKWLGKSIVLTLDHKDGNAGNDLPTNVRLLCPNCHSQTKTFCGKNKGSGRKARGLPSQ